jgi:predicted kinase
MEPDERWDGQGDRRRAQTVARLRERFGWVGRAPGGHRPALILLSGLPGTGKSTVAQALAQRYGVLALRSDEVRKALFARPRYTNAENAIVYLTCYALLRALLADGFAVVFDATNLLRGGRRKARAIAAQAAAPVLTVQTVAPPEVVADRLARRVAGEAASFSSDADWHVYQKLAGTAQPVREAAEPAATVDTSKEIEHAIAEVGAFLRTADGRPQAAAAGRGDGGRPSAVCGPGVLAAAAGRPPPEDRNVHVPGSAHG